MNDQFDIDAFLDALDRLAECPLDTPAEKQGVQSALLDTRSVLETLRRSLLAEVKRANILAEQARADGVTNFL